MLTALELVGFKSFADKTRLEFHSGVTCVVGPNGSGKSNVVDAIKWVLGSQSPKSLRGSEMTDVIFNGAAGRRPLNTAEVTLEFDNRGGLFELGEPSVRITRRVYRSGEGEYAINGSTCRLRDIRELLAGTGVGTESYNIIEQGRVDAVLRASPKDRRTLFEEAAGISRFRLKKQEATRRLARVEQNLLRLSDIVDEVEGRLRRVRMQAGKARRFREQKERLKELRTAIGLADWRVLTSRLEGVEERHAALAAEHASRQQQVDEGEATLEAVERETDSLHEQLDAAERELAGEREKLASHQARITSDAARLADLEAAWTHSRRRLVATRIEASGGADASDLADVASRLDEARRDLSAAEAKAQQAAGEALARRQELQQLAARRDAIRQRRETIKQELATDERDADRHNARLDVARSRRDEHGPLVEQIERQRDAAEHELTLCRERLAEDEQAAAPMAAAAAAAERRVEELRDRLTWLRGASAKHQALVAALQSRLAHVRAAGADVDRLRDAIVSVLPDSAGADTEDAGNNDAATTIRGLVADVLHVDYDTAPMIEAALGARAHHLVVDDGAALLDALEDAGERLPARASFERLDAHPPGAAVDRIDLNGTPGVMGRADQFVVAEPHYAALVERLLGRTWLVDTLATARRLAATTGAGLDFVTYAGELLTADGLIVAGTPRDDESVLTTRRQAKQAGEELAGAESRLSKVSTLVAQAEEAVDEAVAQLRTQSTAQAELRSKIADQKQRVAALHERRDRLEDERARVAADRDRLSEEIAGAEAGVTRSKDRREALNAELAAASNALAETEGRMTAFEAQHAELERVASEARVAISGHEQHAEILAGQLAQLRRDATQRGEAETAAAGEVEETAQRVKSCQLAVLAGGARVAELQLSIEQLAEQTRGARATRRAGADAARRLAKQVHEARRAAESARSRLQRSELDAERAKLERTALVDRMQEEFGVDLAEAARSLPDAPELDDRSAAEEELAQLRGQVQSVGAVNLDALEELDELEERFAELSGQYNDLSEAKTSLERLATRISTESRQLFSATVEEVRGHFRELFRRLFGGGEADIVMIEPEGGDPLDAGVEIAASPPGKELRSISLLSGGEKTLTCVALLLAIFRTKPSPFCVLDEVDAALDESNIGRFTGVLSEFLSSTQFIVVSHSKKTMTGADTLYGVTMQESGVSKQVAVRFEDVGEDGQIDPAATLRRSAPVRRAA